jgi:hypothetical protein
MTSRRQKQKAARELKVGVEDVHLHQRIVFRRRHQNRAIGDQRQAEVRVEIAIGPEQHAVVPRAVAPEVLEQLGHVGAVLAKPLLLLRWRGAVGEHEIAQVHETVQLARPRDRKAEHAQRADPLLARRIVILPRDVILRGRREDRDVVARGEVFGDKAAMAFRAAGDVGAEAMDDAGELQGFARVVGFAGFSRFSGFAGFAGFARFAGFSRFGEPVSSRRRRALSSASSSMQAKKTRLR